MEKALVLNLFTPGRCELELQSVNLLVWENFSRAMRANSMTVGWASELCRDRKRLLALVAFQSANFK